MHRALNERSYSLIEIKIRKTLQVSTFSFIVLNLVEKDVLRILLIMVDYVKGALKLWKYYKDQFSVSLSQI